MAVDSILILDDDSFDDRIGKTPGAILVDFWAGWCAPCRALAPTLAEISIEMAGQVTVAKVNVDDNGDLVSRFGIRSIPTLMVFRGGKVVDQMVGNQSKEQIRRLLEKHIA